MKVKISKPVEIEVKTIHIVAPVIYKQHLPRDFPCRDGDSLNVTVDVDTGKIQDYWPEGVEYDLCLKVGHGGSYWLYAQTGEMVAARENKWIPNGIVPGPWGEFIEIKIAGDGTITNWPKKPDVYEFFCEEE